MGHSQRAHALLSASGSHRWLKCPPSARLEDKVGINKTSVYAKEGTLAHEFSEILLMQRKGDIDSNVANKVLRKIKNHKFYDKEMDDFVEEYVNIVWENYQYGISHNGYTSELAIEEKVYFEEFVPDGFSTPDARFLSGDTVHVFDLKYGKGVEVKAKENTQLMIYGLGAYIDYELEADIKYVHLHIVQPRLGGYTDYKISLKRLLSWAEKTLKPKAQMAYKGEGRKKAGDHCRFCKVKATCRSLKRKALEIAKHDFAEPAELTLQELSEVQTQKAMITDWLSAVTSYLVERLKEGEPVPGYKIVAGRSNRKWKDEKTVIEILEENEFTSPEYMKSQLKGIGDIQKLVGKDLFESHLKDQLIKPVGAPTLALLSDKRPAFGLAQAKSDFAEPIE